MEKVKTRLQVLHLLEHVSNSVLFVTRILYSQIGVEFIVRYLGTLIHLLQHVISTHHLLVESLTHYLVKFLAHQLIKSLTHYAHHHLLQKFLNLLNPHMNTLRKKGKPSSLPKMLSLEFGIFIYNLVFVHLPLIKKHNSLQFFHPFLAKWEPQ